MFVIRPSHSDLYTDLRLLIRLHFLEQRQIGYYASELNVDKQKLNQLILDECGKTVHQLITERLVKESKRWVGGTSVNIKEITYRLGFADMAQFCKFFKKHVGLTPSEYRIKGVDSFQNSFKQGDVVHGMQTVINIRNGHQG